MLVVFVQVVFKLSLETELTRPEGLGLVERNKLAADSHIENHNRVHIGVRIGVDREVYSWNLHHYRYFCCNDRDKGMVGSDIIFDALPFVIGFLTEPYAFCHVVHRHKSKIKRLKTQQYLRMPSFDHHLHLSNCLGFDLKETFGLWRN